MKAAIITKSATTKSGARVPFELALALKNKCEVTIFAQRQNADQNLKNKFKNLKLLNDYGPFLKPPDVKKLRDKLYELRIPGKIAVRILYTILNGEYYLLHAFKKKSDKTPSREIKLAIDRIGQII